MSRSPGCARVSIDVDCSLHQFEDKDILAYAAELIRGHKATKPPDQGHGSHVLDQWRLMDEAIEDVARAVGYSIPNGNEDAYPYPASTAATVTSLTHLRAICGREAPAKPGDAP